MFGGLKLVTGGVESKSNLYKLIQTVGVEGVRGVSPLPHGEYFGENLSKHDNTYKGLAGILPQLPNSPPLTIFTTKAMRLCAADIAKSRTAAHDGNRAASENQGSDEKNRQGDYYGCLAELALMDAMEREGINPQDYVFITDRAPKDPDFKLSGKTYDVKACLPRKQFACINQGKHLNPQTRPECYTLCLFETEDSFRIAVISANEVDGWMVMQGANGRDAPYYSMHRGSLTPITDLSQFLHIIELDDPYVEVP